MSKAAFVILAAGDQPESLDRVVNALMGALEYIESGSEVQVIFDGAGTQAAAELAKPDHKYHDLFAKVRDRVTGVCSYCRVERRPSRPCRSGSRRSVRNRRLSRRGCPFRPGESGHSKSSALRHVTGAPLALAITLRLWHESSFKPVVARDPIAVGTIRARTPLGMSLDGIKNKERDSIFVTGVQILEPIGPAPERRTRIAR